jgi:hypothetical protein
MRPIRITVTDVGQTDPIPLDQYLNPFNVSLRTLIDPTPGPTYTVEYTESDIWAEGYDPDTDTWNALAGMDAAIADAYATLVSPVTAVRMRVTAVGAPTDSVELTVLQSGAVS